MDMIEIVDTLKASDVFSACSAIEMSRLMSFVEIIKLKKGDYLYKQSEKAEKYFFIIKGKISLKKDSKEECLVDKGFVGEEGVIGPYKFDAEALEDMEIVALANNAFETVFEDKEAVLDKLYQSFLNSFSFQKKEIEEKKDEPITKKSLTKTIVRWSLAVIVPTIVAIILPKDLSWGVYYFSVITTVMIMLWIFDLMPFYLPMFMLLLATAVLQIVPYEVIAKGLASSGFLLAISLWGLAIIIFDSLLFYRVFLWIIKILPKSFTLYLLSLLFINIFMTPFVPISSLRYRILQFLENEISKVLKLESSDGKLAIIVSIFFRFGPFFLTGTIGCFMIYALIPQSDRYLFTWDYWLYCTVVVFGLSLLLLIVIIVILTRNVKIDDKLKIMTKEQLKVLGRIKGYELFSLTGIAVFIVGIIVIDINHYDVSLVCFGLLMFLLLSGILNATVYETKVNWTLLLYLGIAIGFIEVFSYLQMPHLLMGDFLQTCSMMVKNNIYLFIAILVVISAVLNLLFYPIVQFTILLCFLAPIASVSHVDFWVIAVVALICTRLYWPLLYNPYFKYIKKLLFQNIEVNNKKFVVINLCFNFIVILGIYISISFWKMIGLM